jgi:uncharacterized membrane protein
MRLSWRTELPLLFLIATMFVAAAVAWWHAPDRMPVHWNAAGQVDRWGGKFQGLLLMPLVATGMYLLTVILPMFDPGRGNYGNFFKAYYAIRISILVCLAAIYAVMLLTAFGHQVNVTMVMMLTVGLLLVVIGNYLSKIRPNWFVGVRTPWTLSSKLSWDKTHRLAGWLFMFMGLLFVGAAFVANGWTIVALLVIDALCLAWIIVYSYLAYRNDPHRATPAGITPSNE